MENKNQNSKKVHIHNIIRSHHVRLSDLENKMKNNLENEVQKNTNVEFDMLKKEMEKRCADVESSCGMMDAQYNSLNEKLVALTKEFETFKASKIDSDKD